MQRVGTTVRFHGKRLVNMDPVVPVLYAFAVGVTACGLAGSAMELLSGRRLAFAEPYVSPVHILRSLAATACAGPFMLTNEALAARREGRIGTMALLSCGCTAIAWALALGVVLIAIASWATENLGSFEFAG
ncbi:DUF6949 family protein [Mesorhizobium sp. CA4]|uniref:DUF6949 family protein n=1 Tax=unclassified Mesorhizobium TaxID=325217 RepID=UPI00398CB088